MEKVIMSMDQILELERKHNEEMLQSKLSQLRYESQQRDLACLVQGMALQATTAVMAAIFSPF